MDFLLVLFKSMLLITGCLLLFSIMVSIMLVPFENRKRKKMAEEKINKSIAELEKIRKEIEDDLKNINKED